MFPSQEESNAVHWGAFGSPRGIERKSALDEAHKLIEPEDFTTAAQNMLLGLSTPGRSLTDRDWSQTSAEFTKYVGLRTSISLDWPTYMHRIRLPKPGRPMRLVLSSVSP